ncbi:MAG: hypothetical protein IT374_08580 [Polyangiaceae bacterium]|nr:hypothetical protein [Polyangiaceae bacterium]
MRRAAALVVAALALSAPARADDRVASDLALAPELVGAASGGGARAGVGARGHYLATVGAYARAFPSSPARAAVGVDARPLFLPRWLKNQEGERSFLELVIDSLHLSMGAVLEARARPSFEIGGGLEVPVQATFTGAYVGVEAMWWARQPALAGAGEGAWVGVVSLGYRFGVVSHAVDARDRR